jgi:drug/metabolite transporter (DMT)-like permease
MNAAAPAARLPPTFVLIMAVALMSAMDATIKHLAVTNHVLLVTFARYALGTMFALGIWLHAGRPIITADMWRAHSARGLVIAIAATSFFWSLTVLPLVDAVTLSFFSILMVPFCARLVVGERVRASSFAAVLAGFAGVVIAVQGAPSAQAAPLYWHGVVAIFVSGIAFAFSVAMMRARARTDAAAIVTLLASLLPGLIVAAPAIALSPPPRLGDWPYFLAVGALAAIGMFLMARAYARAEAQQLAPIHYTELLWASLIGYFLFAETPRPQVFAGAALIIGACLYAVYDERRGAARAK